MGKKINEYPDTAATVEAGSWFDIDQDLGGGSFQSQKLSLAVLQVALGVFYCVDGTMKEARQVNLDNFSLEFLNGQTVFGGAPTVTPANDPVPTQQINFNLGNYHTIDLENLTNDLTVSFVGAKPNGMYQIKIIQGAGLVNVIWPAQVKWATGQPLIVTTIDDAHDRVTLFFDPSGSYDAVFADNFQ